MVDAGVVAVTAPAVAALIADQTDLILRLAPEDDGTRMEIVMAVVLAVRAGYQRAVAVAAAAVDLREDQEEDQPVSEVSADWAAGS